MKAIQDVEAEIDLQERILEGRADRAELGQQPAERLSMSMPSAAFLVSTALGTPVREGIGMPGTQRRAFAFHGEK
jgi:hypothetical protein